MSPNAGGGGWGSCRVSANEYSYAQGVPISFGDLTPYLTYFWTRADPTARGRRQVSRSSWRLLSLAEARLTARSSRPRHVTPAISASHTHTNTKIFWLATFTERTHMLSSFSGVPAPTHFNELYVVKNFVFLHIRWDQEQLKERNLNVEKIFV
jgi:hypothetical protein